MPRLWPVNAITYASGIERRHPEVISSRLAPPYDVVDPALRARLLAEDPDNVVAIDAVHVPADSLGPEEAYVEARRRLDDMLARGVLVRHREPRYFVTRQTYATGPAAGSSTVRRTALLASLPLQPMGPDPAGGIFAHEQTRQGLRTDRLALLASCRTQTSPIFGLYSDPAGRVEDVMRRVMLSEPAQVAGRTPDGTVHEMWMVRDREAASATEAAMLGLDVIVADGHNRYASALTYLETLGRVPVDHPARKVLFALVSAQDPGMSIRPVHRVFSGMIDYSLDRLVTASEGTLLIHPSGSDLEGLPKAILRAESDGWHAMGLHDFATGESFVAVTEDLDPLVDAFPEHSSAWRQLDPVICQHLLYERVLGPRLNRGRPPVMRAVFDLERMRAMSRVEGNGAGGGSGGGRGSGGDESGPAQLGVVLQPVRLSAVLGLSPRGALLPADSTFFWPKMASGLVLNSLE